MSNDILKGVLGIALLLSILITLNHKVLAIVVGVLIALSLPYSLNII